MDISSGVFAADLLSGGNGPSTQADLAFEKLEHLIVSLELMPGELITESQVRDRLGFGRTPSREALLRLRYARLIEPGPGRSHMVTRLDFDEMVQIIEVASAVERLLVAHAAGRRTPAEARRFAAIATTFAQCALSGDVDQYLLAMSALNALIGSAARQPVAARSMAPLIALTRRLAVVHFRFVGQPLIDIGPLHAALARAIGDGRQDATCAALDDLLRQWTNVTESLAANAAMRELTIGPRSQW